MQFKIFVQFSLSLLILSFGFFAKGATVSGTYTTADIPTNNSSYSATCNGPVTTLSIALPAGTSWDITSVDISYDMTAASGAWKSEQRSLVYCQNTTTAENGGTYYSGSGASAGTQSYSRSTVNIANGTYAGGTSIVFEMRAYRTWTGGGTCNTTYNKVENNTWSITINYVATPTCPDPSSLGASSILTTQADLGWTENGSATTWDIELGLDGFTPTGTPTQSGVTSNPYTYTGLIPNTDYDFYVRAYCGVSDESTWVGPFSFTTAILVGQVYLSATLGTTSGTYSTLKGAFDKINDGTHQGGITINIGASDGETVTETAEAALNKSGAGSASYTSVNIHPGAANIKLTSSISGSCCLASATLRLNEANNVTIDGRQGGIGSTIDLTIENSAVASWGVALIFVNASNNTLRYCTLKSSNSSTSGGNGTLAFKDNNAAGGDPGCDNNIVEYCHFTKSGSTMPLVAIASDGNTVAGELHNSNTIRNCSIYNFQRFGIWLSGGSSDGGNRDWTITNNSIYQPEAFASMSYDQIGICIGDDFTASNGEQGTFTITNNTIGGNGSGGDWTCESTTTRRVAGISINSITTAITRVDGNTIKNFNVKTTNTSTDYGMFSGIVVSNGKVSIGGQSGNTIGSTSDADNIIVARNNASTGGMVSGIQVRSSSDLGNVMNNNTIGGISITTGSGNFTNLYGIRNASSTTYPEDSIYSNTITDLKATKVNYCYGIYGQGLIAKNSVTDLDYSGPSSFSELTGISWGGGEVTGSDSRGVENNEVILGKNKSGSSIAITEQIIGIEVRRGDADVYFNSVLIEGTHSGSENTYAVELPNSGTVNYYNNLMYNERSGGSGKHYAIYKTGTGVAFNSTNNAYVTGTGGNNYLGNWLGTDKATLTDWNTSSGESSSISDDSSGQPPGTLFPQLSSNRLDVSDPSWLESGVVLANPTTDITNEARDGVTPTIGAYEKSVILPVELVDFWADCDDEEITLNWATLSETNNDFFTVLGSEDGNEFFELSEIPGAGNSSVKSWYDWSQPVSSFKYFKLQQTDFDGSSSYSTIALANCEDKSLNSISLFPNPSNGDFTLATEEFGLIEVRDLAGKMILNRQKQKAQSLFSFGKELPAGTYILMFKGENNTVVEKIIKL